MAKICGFIGLLFLFVACDNNTVFSEYKSFSKGWDKAQNVNFKLPALDQNKNYALFINIRNSNNYPYSNLFLIVKMDFPHGKTLTDTLEYLMAEPDGTWLGKSTGSVRENKLWYKENISFNEKGQYAVNIQHAMRNNGEAKGLNTLKGITDVGFSIEEKNKE